MPSRPEQLQNFKLHYLQWEAEISMKKRPLTFADPGRFEIYSHHSAPTLYAEESHETVQICVPMERALYSVTRQSETGRTVVHNLGTRDVLVIPVGQPHSVNWRRPAAIALGRCVYTARSLHFRRGSPTQYVAWRGRRRQYCLRGCHSDRDRLPSCARCRG